ncbi:tyrosine-protein phosphatase [Ornithinimicrobium murale]|uniref:tyrosine-protein phosphatase n=1 Tax=Ornithinimicrobium murale TaxID=1050153 RepID=UPI000E0D2B05|nr:tyrosine-protein phosphatase [Ornithinimicrobium murale]
MPSASKSTPGLPLGRLDVPGTHNFREVAPGSLRPGRLYRSDGLHRLSRAGRRALTALGVEAVVDLRSDFDRRFGGRDRLRGTGADLVSIPIAGAPPQTDPAGLDLRWVYRTILTHHRADLGTAIRVVADAQGPVVIHCTAGKDRTGLVVALTLSAVGIDRARITADYVATQANLDGEWTERMVRKVRRFRVPVTDTLLEVLAHSPAPVLHDTLEWLEAEHGGVRAYLAAAGVDDPVIARLRERLLPRGGVDSPDGRR